MARRGENIRKRKDGRREPAPADFLQELFRHREPVEGFFPVEHELAKQHHQKRSAERRYSHMRLMKQFGVIVGLFECEAQDLHARYI